MMRTLAARLRGQASKFHALGRKLLILGLLIGGQEFIPHSGVNAQTSAHQHKLVAWTSNAEAKNRSIEAAFIEKARARRISVIVGLRIALTPEHQLSPVGQAVQAKRLSDLQDRVAIRVLGSTSASGFEKYDFIPFVGMIVGPGELERLFSEPSVVSVEEDDLKSLSDTKSVALIHAEPVWQKGFSGNGTIAVLDTGVYTGTIYFPGKLVGEACFSSKGVNVAGVYTSLCPNGAAKSEERGSGANCDIVTTYECHHGTLVAGIALAARDSNKIGVAYSAKLLSIKVMSLYVGVFCQPPKLCLTVPTKNIINALQYVYLKRAEMNVVAVNLSFGGGIFNSACDGYEPAVTSAIKQLRLAGIPTFIASGNEFNLLGINSPACISYAVAVGATERVTDSQTHRDEEVIAAYSNDSPLVQFVAPGAVVSTIVPINKVVLSAKAVEGTSMAAPHVAGAFAILKQAKPQATIDEILTAMDCSGKPILMQNSPWRNHPRIDVEAAFDALLKNPPKKMLWNFTYPDDAMDWAPLNFAGISIGGKWRVDAGSYIGETGTQSHATIITGNCDRSLALGAIWQSPPGGVVDVWFKAHIVPGENYPPPGPGRSLVGYVFSHFLEQCKVDFCYNAYGYTKKGLGFGRGELSRVDLDSNGMGFTQTSLAFAPLANFPWRLDDYIQVDIVSYAGRHMAYVNSKPVFSKFVLDSGYGRGSIALAYHSGLQGAGSTIKIDRIWVQPAPSASVGPRRDTIDPLEFAPKPSHEMPVADLPRSPAFIER